MKPENLARIVVLAASAALGGSGCAASGESAWDAAPAAAEESTATTADELKGAVGGGGHSFSCGALGCICSGDFDCNNMFSSDVCGSWPAKCYERGPAPVYCICAPWVRTTRGVDKGDVAVPGGVLSR